MRIKGRLKDRDSVSGRACTARLGFLNLAPDFLPPRHGEIAPSLLEAFLRAPFVSVPRSDRASLGGRALRTTLDLLVDTRPRE